MGITNSNKIVDRNHIGCDGIVKITLSLAATPDIMENPVDIDLALDRSGSMEGSALANLKLGANRFIDIIDESTDGKKNGMIGGGSRIAIVSFADTAVENTQLTACVNDLKSAVNGLKAGGDTNHGDAFLKSTSLLSNNSNNKKILVMFTDGKTTTGAPPSPLAAAARAAGITIYMIGLVGEDGIDVDALRDWATDPDTSHVAITPDEERLEELFENLARNISKPGATGIVINEMLNPDFKIINVLTPSKGSATVLQKTSLRWTIDRLGVSGNEGAVLEFFVKHVNSMSGAKRINRSITYTDNEHNMVRFPDPIVHVDCGIIVRPEECPDPIDVVSEGCNDFIEYDLGDTRIDSMGKILQLDVNLKNICPGRRVALAVILTEVEREHDDDDDDDRGRKREEHNRGLKIMTIPAHHFPTCRDIKVKCIKFVLPNDLDDFDDDDFGRPERLPCRRRHFRARVIGNYIDSDFDCCGEIDTDEDTDENSCSL